MSSDIAVQFPKKLTAAEMEKRVKIRQVADSHLTVYSNQTEIMVSPWDVRFRFGLLVEASVEQLVVNELAEVYMSPQHAKAFLNVLKENIEKWDAIFGKDDGLVEDASE